MIKNVVGMYFSPSGATAKITKKITIELTDNMRDSCLDDLSYSFYDMMCLSERHGINTSIDCTDETIVVMRLPVMSGSIPEICKEMLAKVNGNGAYLIALVSYGNNSYGDALYELYTYANERGFNVISAAAFIAQHSMFPKVAESRPDANDIKKMIEFSRISAKKLKRFVCTDISSMRGRLAPLMIPGSIPKRKPMKLPIHPTANSLCISCGKCKEVCPVGAISTDDLRKSDPKECISCTSCIKACPQDARGFYGSLARATRIAREKLHFKRKDPEWFI